MAAPTRAKKRLGRLLVELRTRADKSLADAATELKTSDSTVSRYESGQVRPVWSTVLILLRFYAADAEERERATRLWEDTRDEAPPVRLPAGTHKTFRQLVNAEREAETVRTIERTVVPGLLQTEGYSRALLTAGYRFNNPKTQPDGIIARRLTRQRRLREDEPLVLHALIDEAVVRRVVGGPDVMSDQLEHLLKMSKRDNIVIQIVPYSVGAYGTMNGGYVAVGFEDDETPSVYLEYPAGGAWVENEDDVRRFTTTFADAVEVALSPAETAELIQGQIGALTDDEHHNPVAHE